jgi:hypothetical protein
MLHIDFLLPEANLRKLKIYLQSEKNVILSEIRNFHLWGKLYIAVDSVALFRPPIWPLQRTELGEVADVGLLDFFVSMDKIVNQLCTKDQSEAPYYFVEHDYAIRLRRDFEFVKLAGLTLVMSPSPPQVEMKTDFDGFLRELARSASRFNEQVAKWDPLFTKSEPLRMWFTAVNCLASHIHGIELGLA